MLGYRILLALAAATLVASAASALPEVPEIVRFEAPQPGPGLDPDMSCAVASVDEAGSDVQPFVDPAATGARVGTPAASVTFAVYPFACSYVVLQLADLARPIPRQILPDDTPYGSDVEHLLALVLA